MHCISSQIKLPLAAIEVLDLKFVQTSIAENSTGGYENLIFIVRARSILSVIEVLADSVCCDNFFLHFRTFVVILVEPGKIFGFAVRAALCNFRSELCGRQ